MNLPPIDTELAAALVRTQFPQWADLRVEAMPFDGWDNRSFRLGDALTMRLPSGDWYAEQVAKEQQWLPVLAPQLPLPIPTPVAAGVPGCGYPYPWSVYRWIPGATAAQTPIVDPATFASALAAFLVALRRIDATGGPEPGPHNFYRGGPLTTYAEETEQAIAQLGREIDGDRVRRVWDAGVATRWDREPVWFHGDVAAGNLLLDDGRLAAVIDFGSSGVGDPACDLVVTWTLLPAAARPAFRAALGLDPDTWARGRGWALWKSVISLVGDLEDDDVGAALGNRRIVSQLVQEAGGV